MKKNINVMLAHASIMDINRGCVALTLSIMYILHIISKKQNVNINYYISNSGIQKEGSYSCLIDGEAINYYAFNMKSITGTKNKIKLFLHFNQLKKNYQLLKKMDYVLNIGRGDSFSDIYGKQRFYYTDDINKLSYFLKIPYCLLPQTIGPFEDNKILEKAKKSIRNSSMVMARDRQSFDYVREICPEQSNICEYIDVAFFLPFKKTTFDSKDIHVGLNISAFMLMGGYTGDNQFGLAIDYDKIIRKIIDYFLSIKGVKIHLIGHVVSGERFIESDYVACRDLFYEYNNPNLILADFFLGPVEAKNYISGLDFFMGARMHATIAAFSSGVPVVPMAYSRKFNGLFLDTLDYPYMVDMKQNSLDEALGIIKLAFEQRNQLQEIIRSRLDGVVEKKKQQLIYDLTRFIQL